MAKWSVHRCNISHFRGIRVQWQRGRMTSAVEAEVDVDVDVDADAYPRQTVCVCEMLTLLLAPGRILQRVCLSACLHCTLGLKSLQAECNYSALCICASWSSAGRGLDGCTS